MNDDEQVSSINWKWFCILAGIMVTVGVATYFFLPSLISKTETDLIIVKAVETPFKVKPTEPSGKIVDHQNLLIVDILTGGTKEADQTETLRPSAPNPEPPPVNIIIDAASKNRDEAGKKTETIDVAQKAVIEGNAPLYMIQLAAFRSAKRAAEMAEILSQKHKSRLKDVDLETMRVDNGSNGIFHRIVSVPLPRQDADKMCSILRRSGQDCFLRKYETTTLN